MPEIIEYAVILTEKQDLELLKRADTAKEGMMSHLQQHVNEWLDDNDWINEWLDDNDWINHCEK